MAAYEPFIALNRFGLGARPGDAERIAADPRGWLHAQVAAAQPEERVQISPQELSAAVARGKGDLPPGAPELAFYERTVGSRLLLSAHSDRPFHERWVAFWTNHFTVSTTKNATYQLAVPYEQDAIRPNVYGAFYDLLLAATRHPAMLIYLDQVNSVGPYSVEGMKMRRGLNENLAREIMELHTLGVGGGYSQEDIVQFAKILTGWTCDNDGSFMFILEWHHPRDKVMLGETITWGKEDEGLKALKMLASHPSTARFIATKLARHFVSDNPPAAAVEKLAGVFTDTGGDLKAMAHAVIELPGAWEPEQHKVRRPDELVIAALRATDVRVAPEELVEWLSSLGQAPFGAPAPEGWADDASEWLGPNALGERVKLAFLLAARYAESEDPVGLAKSVLGPHLSERTERLIARAESRERAVALFFSSPEFQRR